MNLENLPKNPESKRMLSVVIPAYNEELVIETSVNRIRTILNIAQINHEIIVVNDGSTDSTLEVLRRIQKTHQLRIISIDQNAGHMNAIRSGLEASTGRYVATIDADLQDPPEAIPEMLKLISSNIEQAPESTSSEADVIQAFRSDRNSDSLWKRQTASLYYYFVKKFTGISIFPHAADFRIMKRHVVDCLVSLPEKIWFTDS